MQTSREICLVAPVYNESLVLPAFIDRVTAVLDQTGYAWRIVFADDGSTDGTSAIIRAHHARDQRIGLVSLSRNFGKEIALTAGLDHAVGDAVIVIDADLQDPPELIPDMIARWEQGYDVVYARRTFREGESALKRLTAHMFYRVLNRLAEPPIPADVGDFRLMNRRAVDALLKMRERHRFMKGLFAWVGFRQAEIRYTRSPRAAGVTKWNYWRLLNFSIEGITSFSFRPLQFASYLGLIVAAFAILYGLFIIYHTLVSGRDVAGYPSLIVVVLFLGGAQLMTLGIIGEYLGRMSDELKQRPLYLVIDALLPSRIAQPGSSGAPGEPSPATPDAASGEVATRT